MNFYKEALKTADPLTRIGYELTDRIDKSESFEVPRGCQRRALPHVDKL